MQQTVESKHRLSYRLLRWVIATTLIVGGGLSLLQIILDYQQAQNQLDQQARQILDVVKDPATQSIYSIDPELAVQVLEGLFKQDKIRYASIRHPDDSVLAERERPLVSGHYRIISDPIFGQEKTYRAQLVKSVPEPVFYGNLIIKIDTAFAAETFLQRSLVVFMTGLTRAMVLGIILYFVCYVMLTRPISEIIMAMRKVDPDEPGGQLIPVPRKHEKDELGVWVAGVNELLHAISESQMKRQSAEARILKLSQYDPLTGLPNRLMFRGYLQNAIIDSYRHGQKIAVFVCGIDDFKSINDQYSYNIGDKILQIYAERLSSHNEMLHTASRLGGDQFALIQYNIGNDYQAAALVEALLDKLNRSFEVDGHSIDLYTTIGITIYPDNGEDADKLLQKAEQTMTLAKTVSRNQYQFYVAALDSEMRERKALEKELNMAIENGEMSLYYQPQIDYSSGLIVGAEALIRWHHPERGFVPPDEFIPIAESNKSIIEIGEWVLDTACAEVKNWLDKGLDLFVSVNLSAVQVRSENIERSIQSALNWHHLSPDRIELEVTETGFMENLEEAVERLTNIKKMGISTSVDDFGTGYSSLSYLKRLPIDKLKIDKQFVNDILTDEDDASIVRAIIQLGKSLDLKVIAEGVETRDQEAYLKANHCMMGQGYYYSKPLPAEEFCALVQGRCAILEPLED